MDRYIKIWREDLSKQTENPCRSEETSKSKVSKLHNENAENESSDRVSGPIDYNETDKENQKYHDKPQDDAINRSDLQKGRAFQSHWLNTLKWLQYDEISKKAFCSICTTAYRKIQIKIPSDGAKSERAYKCFVEEGFQSWSKALERFKFHEQSMCHRTAMTAFTSHNQGINVGSLISSGFAQARSEARICLHKIVESIRFLAVQGIPLRGHTEEKSNFIQLLKLRSLDNVLLKSWLERSKYRWLSHDIINEFLSLLSMNVQRKLLNRIASQPFYAVISDETTDISRREQMSMNFLIADENLEIEEIFLGFYETPFTDAKTLFTVVKDVLLRFMLSINKCRGQCYDGAYAVSGEITGLQTRFREEEPRALYSHCAGHNLNLVAQDAMKKIQKVADFLSVMKELVTFVRQSAKRLHIFRTLQCSFDDDEDEESETVTAIKPFCFTRWCVRVKSLKSIKLNYEAIKGFCKTVGEENSNAGIKARGFLNHLNKFETYIMLEMTIATLEKVESLNETLQATKINFQSVMKRVAILKQSLNSMRTDEKFEEIFKITESSATNLHLDEPVLPRPRKIPKRFDDKASTAHFPSTPSELYRPIFFAIIDQIISSIDTRFDSETYKILSEMEEFALKKAKSKKLKITCVKAVNAIST